MKKGRLEAFSDGVIAIIITIMVLELKVPHAVDWSTLAAVTPGLVSYVLSFVFVAIYWNNHHHLMQCVDRVNGGILWANCHLLFWLSLIPFVMGWIAENHFATLPVALYGVVLLCAAIAYFILVHSLIKLHGKDSLVAVAMGSDFKGKISVVVYAVAIPFAFLNPLWAFGLYVVVALMWLCPDPRVERTIAHWKSTDRPETAGE